MVATPWGDSKKLKGRRLSPGRGTPADEVAENQRERIFGAMVASVAERGYDATGVADLSEISGVSTRSLYNLFPGGKEECFLVVLELILKRSNAALAAAGKDEEDWERRLTAIYGRSAEMLTFQPATASLVLNEAHAAGPAAVKALDRATKELERLSRRRVDESPDREGLPTEMVQAQVGALEELARTRLRRGEPEALSTAVPELVDLMAGYRPPPERLRLGNRRPVVAADEIASSEEAERAIRGFTLAVAEHGYAGATIRQIARGGSMSLNTFYANFPDKQTVLLAAIDSSTAQMQTIAMTAFRRSPDWATGVRAAIGGALGFLAARPATAKLLLAEVYAGGSEAVEMRVAGLDELTGMLVDRVHTSPEVPPIAPEVIIAGILTLARRRLLRKGAGSLPSLAPVATYIALAPYVGAAEACTVANGDTRAPTRRGGKEPQPAGRPGRATRWVLLGYLGANWSTAAKLAERLGMSTEQVDAILAELEDLQMVERMTPGTGDGPPEWANVKNYRLIDEETWKTFSERERKEWIEDANRLVIADLNEGTRRGVMGIRPDEHYTRVTLELDEEAWRELTQIHMAAFEATEDLRRRSERRLRDSGERGIQAHSIQYLFEMPEEED